MNDEQTRTRFKTHATWRWELMTARERLSSNTLIVLGNLLVVLAYVLMALVWQRELFLVIALASYQFGQVGARQVPYAYFLWLSAVICG